jgi:sugar lactone lactonase YvrE
MITLKKICRAYSKALPVVATLILTPLFTGCEKDEVQPSDESANYLVTTIAGSGTGGSSVDAQFNNPNALATDSEGNVYVVDAGNFSIRKITSTGTVSTLAGGEQGYEDGEGSAAQFFSPNGVAVGLQGNIYVADATRVRKITASGMVTTLAGSLTPGLADGTGVSASFNSIGAIAADQQGTVYVMDNVFYGPDSPPYGSRIRKISPTQDVTTFYTHSAIFNGLALDSHENIYTIEEGFLESYIQKITPAKTVTKFATIPSSGVIDVSSQDIIHITGFTTDFSYNYEKVYRITDKGKYIAIAGGVTGFADGNGNTAQFSSPAGLTTDVSGNIYVADRSNNRIRKINKK